MLIGWRTKRNDDKQAMWVIGALHSFTCSFSRLCIILILFRLKFNVVRKLISGDGVLWDRIAFVSLHVSRCIACQCLYCSKSVD